jgi:hypothetical protein
MSKQTPTSFEAATASVARLYQVEGAPLDKYSREPASNLAVIFSAIIVTRGIDRLVKAVEKQTRALMIANKMDPADKRLDG